MLAVCGVGLAAAGAFVLRGSPDAVEGTVDPAASLSTLDSMIASGEPLYWDGDFEGAREIWRTAQAHAVSVGDSAAIASSLTWLGLAAFRLGEYEDARSLGEEAL
ncbi:MAG TPA: tetratricopeptide repeat protein, partial [Longimicrobiaceae bacterium]|nr:tetratricopeptide repeat protein [Longimicrobiaceae bacterium]